MIQRIQKLAVLVAVAVILASSARAQQPLVDKFAARRHHPAGDAGRAGAGHAREPTPTARRPC